MTADHRENFWPPGWIEYKDLYPEAGCGAPPPTVRGDAAQLGLAVNRRLIRLAVWNTAHHCGTANAATARAGRSVVSELRQLFQVLCDRLPADPLDRNYTHKVHGELLDAVGPIEVLAAILEVYFHFGPQLLNAVYAEAILNDWMAAFHAAAIQLGKMRPWS